MYKITDSVEVELSKVTPEGLISLQELGVYNLNEDQSEMLKKLLEIYIKENELIKLVNALFINVPKIEDWKKIDLSEVVRGHRDFLFKLIGNLS